MRLEKPSAINREYWLSALGVKGAADERLQNNLKEAEILLLQAAKPQAVYGIRRPDAFPLEGNAIKKHLAGCREMAVMAATLGAGVDRLIRAAQVRDMAQAVILDCGASVLIEQICDAFEEKIRGETDGFLTGRYSPGYGDLPIETQKFLLQSIDGPRKIGLTATKDSILTPRKSVTAVLGISDRPVKGYLATCEECVLREECELRKEGKNCANEVGLE